MESSTFTLTSPDGAAIHVNRWLPDAGGAVRGIVQIAHGMAEHSDRYARFAERLTGAGYAVYANDHRGHKRTAGSHDETGYFADASGFDLVVGDLALVTDRAVEEHPGVPVVLFGHSMGSFLSRAYAAVHGSRLAGLVLSGTAADPGLLGAVGRRIASVEARVRGRRARSKLMDQLSFGQYNAKFKPARTAYDWLSRDPDEVDRYVEDEWCGEVFTAGFYSDVLDGLARVNSDALVSRVPKDLPVLLMSGGEDPVGANGAGVRKVADQLRRLGVVDVSLTLYPGGRHEMLNETNRDEVMADVIAWCDPRTN